MKRTFLLLMILGTVIWWWPLIVGPLSHFPQWFLNPTKSQLTGEIITAIVGSSIFWFAYAKYLNAPS